MTFLYLTIAWWLGIFASNTLNPDPLGWWGWLGLGVTALLMAFFSRTRPGVALPLACIGMALCGLGRYQMALPNLDGSHIAFYNDLGEITLTGLVVDEPDIRDKAVYLTLEVATVDVGGGPRPVQGQLLVQMPRFPIMAYGTELQLTGELETPPSREEFDYRDYLARQNIYSIMSRPEHTILAEQQGHPLRHLLLRYKERAQTSLLQLLPDPEVGLLSGIVLGTQHSLAPEVDEAFRTTGITHIVVISGFNIAIITALFIQLGDPLFGKKLSAWVAIAGIVMYTILVGADPSVVRAAVMGVAYVVGQRVLGRPNAALGSLFLAGFTMTLYNPQYLWSVGFQLSFGATLSLMLYATPLTQWVRRKLQQRFTRPAAEQLVGLLSEAVLVTMAAQVITLPLTMYYFQRVSLISLVANALILPVQPAVMVWGGLVTMVGMVVAPVGELLAYLVYPALWYTIRLAQLLAAVPYAAVDVPYSGLALCLTYGVTAGWTWYGYLEGEQKIAVQKLFGRHWSQTASAGVSCVALFLSWHWYSSLPDGRLHVLFFDVGQGDAIFIQTPSGRQILIDGGFYPTVLYDHLGRQMPLGDDTLDLVIATHPDGDHVTGLPGVLERYEVGQVWVSTAAYGESDTYDAFLQQAELTQTPIYTPTAGEQLVLGDGVTLEVVYPGGGRDGENRNNNSVSVRLVYGDFSLLLTGDAEVEAEQAMLKNGQPLQALVLKAGHHGANNASSEPFLAAVRPEIVVVSAGADNRYGHPAPEVLARVQAAGATVLRTDELGTIEVVTDGSQMWWWAHR